MIDPRTPQDPSDNPDGNPDGNLESSYQWHDATRRAVETRPIKELKGRSWVRLACGHWTIIVDPLLNEYYPCPACITIEKINTERREKAYGDG